MKVVLEVSGFESGVKEEENRSNRWARLTGRSRKGTYCRAVAFGPVAESLSRELSKMIPQGEEIGSVRMVIDLTGEWVEGKEITNGDGSKRRSSSFKIDTFAILTGPVLLLDRIRRDGADCLTLAEQHRKEGRLDLAYRSVAEYLALVSNRPLDLADLEEITSAADEAEFGATTMETPDPEAAAAAHFASVDGVADRMEIAPEADAAIPDEEEQNQADEPDAINFAPVEDDVDAHVHEEDTQVQEDAVPSEDESDVLDDQPDAQIDEPSDEHVEEASEEAAEDLTKELPTPVAATPPPPAPRVMFRSPRPPGM